MKNTFHSATLKLTGWYLLIIMVISISFSALVFQISTSELRRGLPPQSDNSLRHIILDNDQFEQYRQARAEAAAGRLVVSLVFLNLLTLGLGGGAAYFLARRTLSPIEENIEQQTRFVSDASHELKTPLASMRSELEVALRQKKLGAKDSRVLLESNLEEVDKLQALSERLLMLSQSESVERSEVQLEAVVEAVVNRHYRRLQEKNIQLKTTLAARSVRANEALLTDLVSMLVENAIKYSHQDGRVEITSYPAGRHVVLSVKDHGVGISDEDIPHIFERFYRADSSRTGAGVHGHGLGLSIAERIAHLHDTRIDVQSELAKGSAFSIKLPVEKNI